jgi:Ca-activated chloride channel family protein
MLGDRRQQIGAAFGMALLAAGFLLAQETVPPSATQDASSDATATAVEPGSQRPIRIDVDLVLVNVSVIDPYNRFVTGLGKEHFRIFEDEQAQSVTHFSSEDVPISVGLLFDASGSMSDKIDKARMSVQQFFRSSNPADEFFLIGFNDRPFQIAEFTSNPGQLQNKLNFTEAKGRTSLFDAMYLGLHEMKKARYARKVLLVISDGGDNHSRYSERDIKRAVQESDVQIYAIGIYEPYSSRSRTPEELAGPSLMTEIAESTGGRQFPVENLNDLPDIARKIGRELRSVYVLGYQPTNDKRDGKWRKIQVKLSAPRGLPPLQLFSKSGYYAPQP